MCNYDCSSWQNHNIVVKIFLSVSYEKWDRNMFYFRAVLWRWKLAKERVGERHRNPKQHNQRRLSSYKVYKLHNFIVSLIAPYKPDIKKRKNTRKCQFTSERCSNVKYPITKHLSPYRNCKKQQQQQQHKVQPHVSKIVLRELEKSNTELDYLAATV